MLAYRWFYVLAVILALSGCSGLSRPLKPAASGAGHPLTVFSDGFHAGFLVPWSEDLRWLDLTDDDISRAATRVEIGFGADNWVAMQEPSSGATCSTALWGGPGVIMGALWPDEVRPPRASDQPVRFWRLSIDEAGWIRLKAYLHDWADLSIRRVRPAGTRQFFLFSNRRWMLHRNCNDFIIEGLRVAGVDSSWRLGYTASGFCAQMDAIVAAPGATGVLAPLEP